MNADIASLKKERKYEQALREVERRLQNEPARLELLLEQADLLARLQQPRAALQLLCSLDEEAFSPYYLALKAGLLEHEQRHEEAADLFARLADEPQLPPSVARRVVRYYEQRDPERAVHLSQRLQSDEPEAMLLQAEALARQDRNAACQRLREALQRYPGHPRLVCALAQLQLEGLPAAEVAGELRILLSLQENRSNLALRERLVQALRSSQQLDEARSELLECLRQAPDQHYLRANLAYVERDLGHWQRALDLMEELLQENPGDRYVLNAYCKTCRDHGQVSRATGFIADQSSKRPELRRWWGTLKKVLNAGVREA